MSIAMDMLCISILITESKLHNHMKIMSLCKHTINLDSSSMEFCNLIIVAATLDYKSPL